MNNVKAAVYSGTRNIYDAMLPAVKSLLMHSDVDKVYLLIEDDKFPVKLPKEVECINVSSQTYFPPNGPNSSKNYFTYMAYMRGALAKVFPDMDTILALDVDTIVVQDISDIWDIDISDAYFSACREPVKSKRGPAYYNTGVTLYNLKKIREDGIDDKVIEMVNTKELVCPEQDAFSELCQGHVIEMDPSYNCTIYTVRTDDVKVVHYAGIKKWFNQPEMREYAKYSFDEVMKMRNSKKSEKTKKPVAAATYMIHACNERMWYVNEYLVPSMTAQGIGKDNIIVWQDRDRKGNLESFISSMRWIAENKCYLDGVWHLQDDVVISSRFKEITEKEHDGIVNGFCNEKFDDNHIHIVGMTPMALGWFSFQCIRIPNFYAQKFVEWYDNEVIPKNLYAELREEGKNDDAIWRRFMLDNYAKELCYNYNPNLVDHIDYLLGGSIINTEREGSRRAYRFMEPGIVENLEKELSRRKKHDNRSAKQVTAD